MRILSKAYVNTLGFSFSYQGDQYDNVWAWIRDSAESCSRLEK